LRSAASGKIVPTVDETSRIADLDFLRDLIRQLVDASKGAVHMASMTFARR